MTDEPEPIGGLAGALLRLAALWVPRARRADWLREWQAELGAWRAAGRGTTGSAMGAFPHAMWLFWEGWTMRFERLLRDLRVGARSLANRPLFSGTVVATLAIGIGGAVAVFSVVDAVLLRPLPFPDGERIVVLGEASEDGALGTTSFATGLDWRARSTALQPLAIVRASTGTLTGEGEPEQVVGLRASWTFFDVVGVHPALGRTYREDEDHVGAERVVVLSHGLWTRRFAADPSMIGRPVTLSGYDYTVIGVMPDDFEPVVSSAFYQAAEYWTPLRYEPDGSSSCRTCRHLRAVARLAPGVTLDRARTELASITAALAQEYPSDYDHPAAVVDTLHDQVAGPVAKALQVLLAAVGFVLLIACGNTATLMVARATDRRREVSLRAALGAARGDLLSQTFVECLLLALAGGVAGTALGAAGTRLLVAFAPAAVPGIEHVGLNASVTGFALAVTLLTAAVFGIAPVLQVMRADPAAALKEGGRGSSGGLHQRARGALVVADVAVAIVLLVGVGLTTRSFVRVLSVDPGFDPAGVVKMEVNAIGAAYADDADVLTFHQEVLRRVREVPSVESAGLSSQVPLAGNFDQVGIAIEGVAEDLSRGPSPERYAVAGDYLETMRIPLLEGRAFDGGDTSDGALVVLVNETFAKRYWPDGSAVGHRVRMGSQDAPWRTIVGVVGDVRHYALEQAADIQMYLPQPQWTSSYMTLVVRSRTDPEAVVDGVRRAVWAVDRDIPVPQIATFDQLVAGVTAQRRFVLGLMSLFAVVALVLTVVGIYGMLAYHVAQRAHEIGIRMALGADRGSVFRLIVGQGVTLTLVGVAAGLIGSFGLTRFIASMLYGVEPTDPVTLVSVTALMMGVALVACWLPARRATLVDAPVVLSAE